MISYDEAADIVVGKVWKGDDHILSELRNYYDQNDIRSFLYLGISLAKFAPIKDLDRFSNEVCNLDLFYSDRSSILEELDENYQIKKNKEGCLRKALMSLVTKAEGDNYLRIVYHSRYRETTELSTFVITSLCALRKMAEIEGSFDVLKRYSVLKVRECDILSYSPLYSNLYVRTKGVIKEEGDLMLWRTIFPSKDA